MKANGPVPMDEEDIGPSLRLFDRLDVTAQRIFRALGRQRRANAHQRLLRVRRRLILEMQSIGVCTVEGEAPFASDLPCEGTLDTHYELLARAFARCAPIAQRLGRFALREWLLGRAHMHRQHALFPLT